MNGWLVANNKEIAKELHVFGMAILCSQQTLDSIHWSDKPQKFDDFNGVATMMKLNMPSCFSQKGSMIKKVHSQPQYGSPYLSS